METVKYARKSFEVDAVRVTADNIEEVAAWCKGTVIVETDEQNKLQQYIKVDVQNVLNDRQTQAFVGDWVLYASNGFKVYTSKAFNKTFLKVTPPEELQTVTADNLGARV